MFFLATEIKIEMEREKNVCSIFFFFNEICSSGILAGLAYFRTFDSNVCMRRQVDMGTRRKKN